nr:MAG TPA_asm: hypothetical protein [Caudoviricetes sp.]
MRISRNWSAPASALCNPFLSPSSLTPSLRMVKYGRREVIL